MTATARDDARLFVALWPDAPVRDALFASGEHWTWNAGAVRVPAARLHLTLHFIGKVARARLPELCDALALPCAPFAIRLARPALWPGGVAVLESERTPACLGLLHAALGRSLQALGLPVEPRALRPHVTLARRAGAAILPARMAPLRWQVQGYALVESLPTAGYAVLERFGRT